MEKNTVILDIVRYDSLIESEKKANEPKKHTIIIEENNNNYCWNPTANTVTHINNFVCHTDDDAVAKLAEELKTALVNVNKLEDKINVFKMKYPEKEITIDMVKNMSLFEFFKWKRKK